MLLDISKAKMEKLTDICYTALILLENKNIVSFSLENGEHITVEDAKEFTDQIFQSYSLKSDD